ncbi:hypothetical protein RCZ04_12780 [Capnocytophaga sp. HP1101]
MRKSILIISALFVLIGCSQPLDLSKIQLNSDSKSYHLDDYDVFKREEQKGHYEYSEKDKTLNLIDNGERVIRYVFMDESVKNIHFAGLKINSASGAVISDYDGKIAYIQVYIESSDTLKLIAYLMDMLGKPTKIYERSVTEEFHQIPCQEMAEALPSYIRREDGEFIYPDRMVWEKGDVIYSLRLDPEIEVLGSCLQIITKKAFNDKVIFGYGNVEEE